MRSPYHDLPPEAFWRRGVAQPETPLAAAVWPGPPLRPDARIFTMGDAFAGALHRALKSAGRGAIEAETPPPGVPDAVLQAYGWNEGSARTGPLRTAREVAQILSEIAGRRPARRAIRSLGPGHHVDIQRPGVEPAGFASAALAAEARSDHLAAIARGLAAADAVILCLSRDAGPIDARNRTTLPEEARALLPGLPAAAVAPQNLSAVEADLAAIWRDLRPLAPGARLLLCLSPTVEPDWPDAAGGTAALRVAMARMGARGRRISYLPAHDLLSAPALGPGLLDATGAPTAAGCTALATLLFGIAGAASPMASGTDVQQDAPEDDAVACEEALYEAFAPGERG